MRGYADLERFAPPLTLALSPPATAFAHLCGGEFTGSVGRRALSPLPLREKVSPKATDEGLAHPLQVERHVPVLTRATRPIPALRAGPLIRPAAAGHLPRKGRRRNASTKMCESRSPASGARGTPCDRARRTPVRRRISHQDLPCIPAGNSDHAFSPPDQARICPETRAVHRRREGLNAQD